ncbi:MAG: hypothetical protein Q9184_006118 [Pyrenodesmia sp. 2 TL-2023]
MTLANFGSNLLREVKVEGLDELLRTARFLQRNKQRQNHTGNAAIDKLLNAFLFSDQSNLWPRSTSDQHNVTHHQRGPVLELVGATPCSGKTQLLYYMIGLLLLPSKYGDVILKGKDSAVVVFDLGNNLSMLRLQKIMAYHVQSCLGKSSEPVPIATVNSIVRCSLEHLHVVRPQTSMSLLATLTTLHLHLFNTTSHVSANRTVGSIVLHRVDAFLWQDRLEDAEDQASDTRPIQKTSLLSSRFRDLVAHLRRLQKDFLCLIIATSSALSTTGYTRIDGQMVPVLRSHLPNVWKSFVTVRLIVQRETVRKFPFGVSVEEAMAEAGQRREAVDNSVFAARLDWSESDDWREETMAALRAIESAGEVSFRIKASGVVVAMDD